MKKNTLTLRSRSKLSVVQLHAVARSAAEEAASREADELDRALDLINEATAIARAVAETAADAQVVTEARAGAVALLGAAEHLKAGVESLRAE